MNEQTHGQKPYINNDNKIQMPTKQDLNPPGTRDARRQRRMSHGQMNFTNRVLNMDTTDCPNLQNKGCHLRNR